MYKNIITCFTSNFHQQKQHKTIGKKNKIQCLWAENELVRSHISSLCVPILLPGNRLLSVYLSWVFVSFLFFQHTPAHSVSAAYRFSAVSSFNWKLLPFNVSHVSHSINVLLVFWRWNAEREALVTRSNVYVYQSVILMIVPMNVWRRAFLMHEEIVMWFFKWNIALVGFHLFTSIVYSSCCYCCFLLYACKEW